MTPFQKDFNKYLSQQRIIVENYYGRMHGKLLLMRNKYYGDRSNLGDIQLIATAVTNFHVFKHGLRDRSERMLQDSTTEDIHLE